MSRITSLHNSPFALLEVSVRDRAEKIIEHAEERSLFLDSDVCTKARSDLTTTRSRLNSEICWLPGVSPNRATNLLNVLTSDIDSIKDDTSLPPLAKANLLAATFEIMDPELSVSGWCEWIVDFAYTVDSIDPEDVLREINTDRSVSGFPNVKSLDQIEVELEARRSHYTETIKTAINKLSSMKLVEVMTEAVERTTELGEGHAPLLIHELVDKYDTKASRYLEAEAENIHKLVEAIRENSQNGEAAIKPQIDKLEQVARKWDAIAQPIQLSMKAQGLDHKLSHDIAWVIRSLTVDLFNRHDMITTVTRLTKTLQELFAELPEVVERLDEDRNAISEIIQDRKNAEKRKSEEAEEITYQAEVGLVFKDLIRISPDGIEWKGQKISLEAVNKVRWGAVSHSVNGIPTGTTYTIAWAGDQLSDLVMETRREEVYQRFTDSLWKAVCFRLIEQYLEALKTGKQLSIGGVGFDDSGIFLTKHKLFGNESIYKKWGDISYYSSNGSLVIIDKGDKKTYVELPFLSVWNAHILNAMIRLSFKNWKGRLSGLLGD